MGKLTFKGDKPKKRKRTDGGRSQEPVKRTRGENINLDGWSSASCVEDLKGPCIVVGEAPASGENENTTETPTDKYLVVQVNNDAIFTGSDVEVVQDTVNFFGGDDYPDIHKCEPKKVSQVLTLVPVNEYEKSRLDTTRTNRFALKTSRSQYLSATMGLVHAIGENEIFTFTKVAIPNDKLGCDEPRWEIANNELRCVLEQADSGHQVAFVKKDDVPKTAHTQFVIRVHSKNTVKGSRILLTDTEPEDGPNVNKIVLQLYKDTKGKIEINSQLIDRLKVAISTGDINEQIIQEKSRYLSKW